jgi:glycine dehydrogenase
VTSARALRQVSELCHPQTIAVCKSRADGLGLNLVVGNHEKFDYR